MLTGNYTPPQILDIANNQWGLRTPKRPKIGGTPPTRSCIYKIFNAPFYYGYFEWPKNSGNWVKGSHTPMITKDEFDRVQILLGKPLRPAPHTRTFSFTGLLHCGECGSAITAEEKNQIICSGCKHKFATGSKTTCPKCHLEIKKMNNPKLLNYTYYHCTKKNKESQCSQRSVELSAFLNQFETFLEKIQINEKYLNWSLQYLKSFEAQDNAVQEQVSKNTNQLVLEIDTKLDRLLDLRINGEVSEEEYERKKLTLLHEKQALDIAPIATHSTDDIESIFNYAHHARFWLMEARRKRDTQWQREIFSVLTKVGSNLTLTDKTLSICNLEPYFFISEALKEIPEGKHGFEPENSFELQGEDVQNETINPHWLAVIHDIRTWHKQQKKIIHIDSVKHSRNKFMRAAG